MVGILNEVYFQTVPSSRLVIVKLPFFVGDA